MEDVNAWIEDGNANAEGFFIDEDAAPAPEGSVAICVAGVFHFEMLLQSPFTTKVRGAKSPSLKKFQEAMRSTPHDSVKATLDLATKQYLAVADALDEEMAEEFDMEEEGTNDDDTLDALNAAAVQEANEEARQKKAQMAQELEEINAKYDLKGLSKTTVDRILSDYQAILKAKPKGWSAAPDGRNLQHWIVELFDFESGTNLEHDMKKVAKRTGKPVIEMTMTFPNEYPYKPPFIRVIRPRFMFHTGRVTVGGSICTELLTDDGWKPVYDIEAIIETIRMQITDKEAGAKIDHSNTADYTLAEAQEAFQRVAAHHKAHGW